MDQRPLDAAASFDATSGAETLASTPVFARSEPAGENVSGSAISAATVLLFLAGQRRAIEQVANTPQATWLALAFVVLAGLLREYDQESLWHEPWHLLIPLAASTVLGAALFVVVRLIVRGGERSTLGFIEFRRLLTCIWMCAPMAAIYAVPVERWSSAPDATWWNLTFLAIVSVWRVALISRVIAVLFQLPFLAALFPVMLLSDSVAVVLSTLIPLPLLQIMGGIQLSESESLINQVRGWVILLGVVTWPVWLVGAAWAAWRARRPRPASPRGDATGGDEDVGPSDSWLERPRVAMGRPMVGASAWSLAAFGFAAMGIAAWLAQPEQNRRHAVESLLRRGESEAGMAMMNQFAADEFPPHWDPPPRISYGEPAADAFRHLEAALRLPDIQPWIIEAFGRKLVQQRGYDQWAYNFLSERTNDELAVIASLIQRDSAWEPRLAPPGPTSLRCFIGLALGDDHPIWKEPMPELQKEPRPPELLRRLLAVSSESDDCPTEDELRARIDGGQEQSLEGIQANE